MASNPMPSGVATQQSPHLKNVGFLKPLGQCRFSGQVQITDSLDQRWIFYLFQGHLLSVSGGKHSGRRWRRSLALCCPQLPRYKAAWQRILNRADPASFVAGWEYALLCIWLAQQQITPEQANQTIRCMIRDALFDIEQAANITKQIQPYELSLLPPALLSVEEAIAEAQRLWQAWQGTPLAVYSPNSAPLLKPSDTLRSKLSPQFFQTLVNLFNGQHTLRDLAVQTQQDITAVTASLLPYLKSGEVTLISVHDLPMVSIQNPGLPALPPAQPQGELIACVDDSDLVRNMMEELLTSAGYQFLGISNGLKAIGTLIARKPTFIFLDLVMPDVNGHELCEQLRKLSYFRNTPIVILTGNDGYTNRLKSNFVGATDFLSKPLDAGAILKTIAKHLKRDAIRS